jgi:hypothetical protein
MTKKALLFGAGALSLGLAFGHPTVLSQSTTPAQPPVSIREIHVGQDCALWLDESDALSGAIDMNHLDKFATCRLEGIHTSHHTVGASIAGVTQHSDVTIAEQEYLLQNLSSAAVRFVIEHPLPEDWTIDSDPQPVKIADNKAYFLVQAEPGQIVRLHVGERHVEPIADSE